LSFFVRQILGVLQFALVLVVAAIPVALPAVLTVTLAIGAWRLRKKDHCQQTGSYRGNAGVDVLCADKTEQ
jgi:H+-transporting ATPase